MQDISIKEVPPDERENLNSLLEESFEGIYLWHARRTLKEIAIVRVATTAGGERAGLIMLKDLAKNLGYVYYVAVAQKFRRMGIGGMLLDDSLNYFFKRGIQEVYSSIEEDNEPSIRLFHSRSFKEISKGELSKRYGRIRANVLRMKMWIVPGEQLWMKELSARLNDK